MKTATKHVKHANLLKFGLLGITLAAAGYITQNTAFFTSATASVTTDAAVHVRYLDTPTVNQLWADYDAVFLAQENAINLTVTEVSTAVDELEAIVAKIDQDISGFLAVAVESASKKEQTRLSFADPS